MATTHLPRFTTFGEMLRYLRHRARLTQRELAIACGYSESQISRLEQNDRLPDSSTLLAVFVPALSLEDEPETVTRLLELAAAAREPVSSASGPHSPVGRQRAQPDGDEGAPRSNLLSRLTSLVGREEALVTVRELVISQRLVTLTGVGGVGKSSLSQAVGNELVDEFAGGVWLVELAALADAKLLPQSIATLFRLPEQPQRTPLEALTTYFRHKQLLLILDNCEHLIDGCAHLANHLRQSCPNLHILATSRESLRVADEVEWPVLPLETPTSELYEDQRAHGGGDLQAYSAVRLFIERARPAKPTLVWSEQSLQQVAHLCTQLDGIPLAIELAAASLKGMTISELTTRLDERFHLLASGARSAPARHQTLGAAIDWSYNLLPPQECTFLRRLAVFRGGWSLDAAEAMAAMDGSSVPPLSNGLSSRLPNALDLLLQLVNKSLVVAETRGATTRYHLLETIRQYTSEKLRESGEFEATSRQHYAFYLQLAERWREATMMGRRFMEWLDRLEMEMENLRAAYAWSIANNGTLGALCLAGTLWPFWFHRGRFLEGLQWLDESLAAAPDALPAVCATAWVGKAMLARNGLNPTEALALGEEAARLCRQVDDRLGLAYAYLALGEVERGIAEYDRTQEYFALSVELFRQEKWLSGMGLALAVWNMSLVESGRAKETISIYEECLAIGHQTDDHFVLSCALASLLAIDRERGSSPTGRN